MGGGPATRAPRGVVWSLAHIGEAPADSDDMGGPHSLRPQLASGGVIPGTEERLDKH